MTGSIALDVVIGLIFIYLLYSLFASLVAEIISTNLMLRARNLKEAINRMINDEEGEGSNYPRFMELFNILPANYINDLVNNFYNHQEIKYLGRKANLNPSAIKAVNFAKVILDKIKIVGSGKTETEKLKSGLEKLCLPEGNEGYVEGAKRILGRKTAEYIQSIWEDCEGDVKAFKKELENWFDRTMMQTTEWYKQRMQKILLIIGFVLAWIFNVDTFSIVKKLSVDQDAREQMVQMAGAYLENNSYEKYGLLVSDSLRIGTDSTLQMDSASRVLITDYNARLDSLMNIKNELNRDMAEANSVLGLGSWLPNSLVVDNKKVIYPEWVNARLVSNIIGKYDNDKSAVQISSCQKWKYLFGLLLEWPSVFGYFITALAISLGAPFWFDLLSKLMKLRGAVTEK